jgi:hypothetical protein
MQCLPYIEELANSKELSAKISEQSPKSKNSTP